MRALMPLLILAGCGAPDAPRFDGDLASARRIDEQDGRPRRIHGSWDVSTDDPAAAVLAAVDAWPELGIAKGDLVLSGTRHGLAGLYLRFEQHARGVAVIDGQLVARVVEDAGGVEIADVNNATRDLGGWQPPDPRVSEADAIDLAERGRDLRAPSVARLMVDLEPRLVWRVDVMPADRSSLRAHVDALTGEILSVTDRRIRIDGTGYVFDPNPVGSSGDTSLSDANDADQEALTAELLLVTLPRLDGTEVLRGTWADAYPRGTRATDAAHSFLYDRADDAFEEVMAYYHVDRAQQRLQDLGFTDANARAQELLVNGANADNSYYDPSTREIVLGSGGVDDAEDADIIVHEYGHAVQDDQVPGYGSGGDEAAMGEGFGDYLAASFADTLSAQVVDPDCVGEWDATSYSSDDPPCLRRTDSARHHPEAVASDPHDDGEMWSAALMAARSEVGADVMDTVVVEHHFLMSTREAFLDAGAMILATEEALYGGAYQDALRRSLVAQGMSRELTASPALPDVLSSVAVTLENTRDGSGYADDLDETVSYTVEGAVGLRLHFAELATERDPDCFDGACDNVYVTNGDGDLFEILSGSLGAFDSVVVSGDTVNIRLVSDYSVTATGYVVDRIDVMGCADADGDGVDRCSDCDDADAVNFPGNEEACDGADQDCDGVPDDGLPLTDWYADADGDGFGSGPATSSCGPVAGATDVPGDCDDGAGDVFPGAVEAACDGVDNDCDAGTPDATDGDCDSDTGDIPSDDTDDGVPEEEEEEEKRACGCASGPGPAPAWLGLPLLLAARRRRAGTPVPG